MARGRDQTGKAPVEGTLLGRQPVIQPHSVVHRVGSLVVQPHAGHLEVLVDEHHAGPMQRLDVEGIDHPASGVEYPHRLGQPRNNPGADERLVGVPEDEL